MGGGGEGGREGDSEEGDRGALTRLHPSMMRRRSPGERYASPIGAIITSQNKVFFTPFYFPERPDHTREMNARGQKRRAWHISCCLHWKQLRSIHGSRNILRLLLQQMMNIGGGK